MHTVTGKLFHALYRRLVDSYASLARLSARPASVDKWRHENPKAILNLAVILVCPPKSLMNNRAIAMKN